MRLSRIALERLPDSEISGSKPVCGSPELIAAYHVLLRRPAPRHPPYALSSLTTTFTLLERCSALLIRNMRIYSVVNEPEPVARGQWLGRHRSAFVTEGRSLASCRRISLASTEARRFAPPLNGRLRRPRTAWA